MANYTFKLPKAATKKGVQQVGGKYNFEDGELTVSEDVARKIKPILTKFHGCTVSQAKATESSEGEKQAEGNDGDDDAVLAKTATQGTKSK